MRRCSKVCLPSICDRVVRKDSQRGAPAMDYEGFFSKRIGALRAEGRHRVFADLERRCGRFPRALDHRIGAEITVWCSNDYLGMGQHPAVLEAMQENATGRWRWRRRHAQHFGQQPCASAARA